MQLRLSLAHRIGQFRPHDPFETLVSDVSELLEISQRSGAVPEDAGLIIPSATFALYRSGEFRLLIEEKDQPEKLRRVARQISGQGSLRDQFAADLGMHFFYFIRDLAHKHYHHAKSSDAILPLVPVNPGDDTSWRRETTYSLARAVLDARRQDDILLYQRARGIAAYAAAFEENLGTKKRASTNYTELQPNPAALTYDWKHLLASIEARAAHEQWRHGARIQGLALTLSVFIGTFAAWFGAADVREELGFTADPKPEDMLLFREAASWLFYSPSVTIVLFASFAATLYEFAGRGFKSLGWASVLRKKTKRLLYAVSVSVASRVWRTVPGLANKLSAFLVALLALGGAIVLFDLSLGLLLREPYPVLRGILRMLPSI